MNKTVFVNGAAGFVGFHLCERLLAEGFQVIAVDNFCTGNRSHQRLLEVAGSANKSVHFIEADITAPWDDWLTNIPDSWKKSTERVFHLASPASPTHYQKLNLETLAANSVGLKNALHFADSVNARLIFASTSEVYGSSDQNLQMEDQWGLVNSFGPRSCYQEAKRFGEALIYSHNLRHRTKHGLVRIFNTYGPHMNPEDGRVVINFLMQLQRGEKLTVYGSGQQTRSFCYITDLVEGLIRYSVKPITEPVNLGNPDEMTVLQLARMAADLYPEMDFEIVHKPLPLEDPSQRRPDISKAFALLDAWTPEVPLREGLQKMKNWIQTL